MQYIYDQTLRWLDKGLTPSEIVEKIRLPDHMADHPYLQEFYGTVAWSVRTVFDNELGWFSGEAADLNELSRRKQGKRLAKLAGGLEEAEKAAKAALDSG